MIPKVIHYIWLGGKELSASQLMAINSWKRNLSDYKIIEWNEKKIPINELCKKNHFFKKCWQLKLWAFASDYLRLWILKNYGGIYLDTDVEITRNLDPFLNDSCFMGYEAGNQELGEFIGTGIIGAEKGNETISKLLSFYDEEIWHTADYVNTVLFKRLYLKHKDKYFPDAKIYPRQYFSPYSPSDYVKGKNIETPNTFAIHWYRYSWGMNLKGYMFITTKSIDNKLILEVVKIKRILGFIKRKKFKL